MTAAKGPRIAVVGGGQLGRMLGCAGIPLNFSFRFLDPVRDCPAAAVGEVIEGSYDDEQALARLAEGMDVATYEFENVPVRAADVLAKRLELAPGARALAVAQDRVAEKDFFKACGVRVQPYVAVSSVAELQRAMDEIGMPAVLKTRRLGYDGKGQAIVRSAAAAQAAWEALGRAPCIYEALVQFDREVSMVATRGRRGSFVAYPVTSNEHRDGILRVSVGPDPESDDALARELERHVRTIAEHLGYVGTIAVEFFVIGDQLIANEFAPRVHNSGHWTIEGAVTSQFENHLRAITNQPLGDAGAKCVAGMVNLIGTVPAVDDILSIRGARLHLYGKAPKPGRKLGHVTVTARDHDELADPMARLRELVGETQRATSP